MPFDYPEEQDETMMPERKFPAGTQTSAEQSAGVPDLPITWVRSWQRPERDIQAAPQGIGHRILQMGLGQPGSSSAAFIPWNGAKAQVLKSGPGHRMLGLAKSSFDPLEMRLHSGSGQSAFPMSKQKIGHRILAIGQKDEAPMFSPASSAGFQPNVSFGRSGGNQGLFANFVPPGADRSVGREVQNPFFRPGAGLNHGVSSNLPLEKIGSYPGRDGFGRNATLEQSKLAVTGTESKANVAVPSRQSRHKPLQSPRRPARIKNQQVLSPTVEKRLPKGANSTFFFGTTRPDPTWSELREYIAEEARAYGIPVELAEAVARHESNFDVHLRKKVRMIVHGRPQDTYDVGVMQVNSTNDGWITGPDGWRFKVDPQRTASDWKYNIHVGMAILRGAYAGARVNRLGEESIVRETYARYNAHDKWPQLYTVPKGKISQHLDQFMKSWRLYRPKP